MCKIIVITNQKGGASNNTGKTSTCRNLSTGLKKDKYIITKENIDILPSNTLLLDIDINLVCHLLDL